MAVKKYNLSKPEKYVGKDGQEKTYWANVGTMTEFEKQDGSVSRIIEIPAIGLKASVFEQKPRENDGYQGAQSAPARTTAQGSTVVQRNTATQSTDNLPEIEYPEEEINPDDIPF